MPKELWKTTLVIWSEFDPQQVEIDALAREAMNGEAYCSSSKPEYVKDPAKDPDWDGTEFFGTRDDDDTTDCPGPADQNIIN